jgi:hypothetical protein
VTVGIGASGELGLALETVSGTYVAPTKFLPFMSESLAYAQDTVFRRPIKGVPDVVGAVHGNASVAGDVESEVLLDCLIYLLRAARTSVVKTDTLGDAPYTYVFKPTAAAVPSKTLSLTVVRNGVVFGYSGMVVGSFEIRVDGGILMVRLSFQGQNEETQSDPAASYSTETPFGAGMYDIQIPALTSVVNLDGFTFSDDDSATPQYRLRNDRRSPSFITFGERSVGLSTNLDFESKADYDAFKALTAQNIVFEAADGASKILTIDVPAFIKDTYEVGLSGQGDLVQAAVNYVGQYDSGTAKSYEISITTDEDMTVP